MRARTHRLVRGAALGMALVALGWRLWPSELPAEGFAGYAATTIMMMRPQSPTSGVPLAPLFAQAKAAAEETASATGLQLIGVAGRLPDDVQVLLRLPDGRTATLSPGGGVDDWTLVSVAADRVVMSHNGEQVILGIAQ